MKTYKQWFDRPCITAVKHGQYQREMNAQCQQKKLGDHGGRKGGTDWDVDDKANIALVRAR